MVRSNKLITKSCSQQSVSFLYSVGQKLHKIRNFLIYYLSGGKGGGGKKSCNIQAGFIPLLFKHCKWKMLLKLIKLAHCNGFMH